VSSTRARAVGLVAVAAATGCVTSLVLLDRSPRAAATLQPRLATAIVTRTDLVASILAEGQLGYSPTVPVVNELAGVYTALPSTASTIRAGQPLYRVDNEPVVLMYGRTPAWRSFTAGMTPGPDVAELESNLVALGFAHGLLTRGSTSLEWPGVVAIERWQEANGYLPDGVIPIGEVVFAPGPLRIATATVSIGEAATPGVSPFGVTTAKRTVTVPVTPETPAATVGERVTIVLPDGTGTTGTVSGITAISSGAPPSGANVAAGPAGSAGGTGSVSSGGAAASSELVIAPDHPGVTGTAAGVPVQVAIPTQSAKGVLAVPIAALLALAGGGYGVEVVGSRGAHHLVGVQTGLFTGSQVAITGFGIVAGTKVVVAQ
jgi:hypothetical protein